MLELKTSLSENILDIELQGSLDSQSASDFKAWLLEKSVQGYNRFALNCEKLEFISSRGIGALIEIRKLLESSNGRLALYHLSHEVLNLLKFLKISNEIVIKDTFGEVVQVQAGGATVPAPEKDEPQPEEETPETEDEIAESSLWTDNAKPAQEAETSASVPLDDESEAEEVVDLGSIDDGFETATAPPEEKPETSEGAPAAQESRGEEDPDNTAAVKDSPSVTSEETQGATVEETPSVASEESPSAAVEEGAAEATGDDTGSDAQKTNTPSDENDEYIDLSLSEETMNNFIEEEKIIDCPNCREPLKVNRKGQYLCPECRTKFRYPF